MLLSVDVEFKVTNPVQTPKGAIYRIMNQKSSHEIFSKAESK